MNPALRKFSFNESMLENLCVVIKRDVPDDPILDENEPIHPVSIAFCRLFKKPKKAWNSFNKLNIHSLRYVNIKPGHHTFVCKAYNGKVLTVDIPKQAQEYFKGIVEHVLLGLADQILEMKLEEYLAQQKAEDERKALLADKLGPNVDFKVPDGMVLDDTMIDSIHEVINNIQHQQPASV